MTQESSGRGDRAEALAIMNKLWAGLAVGSVVLAPEIEEGGSLDGWWEAVIAEAKGGQYILEWRDFPEQGRFTRTLTQLAIMHPAHRA